MPKTPSVDSRSVISPSAEFDWRERFQVMAEFSQVGVVLLQDFKIVYANWHFAEICGYAPEQLTGMDLLDLIDEHERALVEKNLAVESGEAAAPFTCIASRHGLRFTLEFQSAIACKLSGVRTLICMVNDVSEQKDSMRRLRESEGRYRGIFQNATFGIFQTTLDGKIIDANPSLVAMLGFANLDEMREALKNDVGNQYIAPEDRQRIVSQLAGGEGVVRTETRLRRKDGSALTCRVNIWTARDENGGIDHLEGFIEDISDRLRAEEERQKLERQMLHAQKMESLGVLAGGIAHDFNNLLMGIMGNANLAMLDLPPNSPTRENIVQIEAASKRAAELCRQMLAYAGRGRFVMQPVDVNCLIADISNLLQSSVPANIALQPHLGEKAGKIEGDASQLRQVVMNLVTNAAEAIGTEQGTITIETGSMYCDRACLDTAFLRENLPEGVYSYIEVRDTGAGMSEETISRSFDPFYSTKFPGRGLGLAAVMGIVQAHSGALKVASREGQGTSIKVLLPALHLPDLSAELIVEEPPAIYKGQALILIVDDEETVRAVTRQMLERAGFQTLTASDGVEGIKIFEQHKDEITVVLLDMTMPNMDGVETFRLMREIRGNIKVILSSGYNEQDATSRFIGKGLSGFIQKPYGVADLIGKVHEVLGEAPQYSES